MRQITDGFLSKEFWKDESRRYAPPYFRLEKCARIINTLAHNQVCDLLDVGCGPATLARLLGKNIRYYGVDIFIHAPAPNLREINIAQEPITFEGKRFDLVVAAGIFEYLGELQNRKFLEITQLLKLGGKFIVTFTNFNHLNSRLIDRSIYNNIRTIRSFKRELETYFLIDKWFPSSHNWYCSEPRRPWLKKIQMPLEISIPIITPILAVNYFFICSAKEGWV